MRRSYDRLIGAGDISQSHLAAWQKAEHAVVVAVCDRDATRARARASEFGIPAVYTDAATLFAAEKLDAVDIATWRDTHVELTRLAAAHGVHVLCQKPLAPTLNEAESLVRKSRAVPPDGQRKPPLCAAFPRDPPLIDEGASVPCGNAWRPCIARVLKDANGRRRPSSGRRSWRASRADDRRNADSPARRIAIPAGRHDDDRGAYVRTDPNACETLATLMLETGAGAPV